MKIFITLGLLFCYISLCGQNQRIDIPASLGGIFIYKVPDQNRIKNKLKAFEKYSPDELTPISRLTYHLAISSCRLYLKKDSSLYHFRQAFNISPKTVCNKMRVRHNHFVAAIEKSKSNGIEDSYIQVIKKETQNSNFSWYLWDLPDFDEFAFIEACNQDYPIKSVVPIAKDSTLNSEIIRRRDQKYRLAGDFEKQHKLDKINRDFIDSLYQAKGSLDGFTEDDIYQFSMVAHHSEDCDWVYKWTERLIDLSNLGYRGKSMLGPLLDRMLLSNKGYCTKQDAQKREYFIYMIKDKYPEFVKRNNLDW